MMLNMDKEISSKELLLFVLAHVEEDQKFDDHLGAILGSRGHYESNQGDINEDRNRIS